MEKKKQIGEHIVDHLSERMNEEIVDPVLDEWLAEDESNQEDFKRYKEIWKETGSYLEQKTFNAQYAWDKIDRINKERILDISFQEWRLLYCLSSGFRKWEYLINSRKCWFE